jgi:hypothetical protein
MFSHFRVASGWVRRSPARVSVYRNISTTPVASSSLAPDPPSEAEVALQEALAEQETLDKEEAVILSEPEPGPGSSSEASRNPETYNEFMESIGNRFKYADGPCKWLGNQVVESVSSHYG